MFDKNFYPTPEAVIDEMLQGEDVTGKICYEPQAGKGNIVDRLMFEGASEVIASEINPDLRKIVATKCRVIGEDFLKIESDQISHVNYIIMNPPFDKADEHILHAYNIAPAGCKIISLCNYMTIDNPHTSKRKLLNQIIEENGNSKNLGDCFSESERKTDVEVGLIRIKKPGVSYEAEFEGFFTDEEEEQQGTGIMSYNVVRDLVNRYVSAVKLFDQQLDLAVKMNSLTDSFFSSNLAFTCASGDKQYQRNSFKKDLQKSAWNHIFSKLNMNKYTTKGLRDDINKFVESQIQYPFTMKNVYKMLEIIVGTNSSRMDKALLEVFDKVTESYHENRYNVEGWKTNSHYLINEKFIMGGLVTVGWSGQVERSMYSRAETIEDFVKALCYLTGDNYDHITSLEHAIRYPFKLKIISSYKKDFNKYQLTYDDRGRAEAMQAQLQEEGTQSEIIEQRFEWGKWDEWAYFDIKCYKKGTIHFKFKSTDLWAKFNRKIAELKGYPLPEAVKKTSKPEAPKASTNTVKKANFEPKILGTFSIKS
jgi:hypothetical protein